MTVTDANRREVGDAATPIAGGLFTWPDETPSLIGGRCPRCAAVTFPLRNGCPRCGAVPMEQYLLNRFGTLWSWTSQGFRPKEPFNGDLGGGDFETWFIGVVDLDGEVRVEALLVDVTQETLQFDMPMQLVVVPFRTDEDGKQIVTFAFAPESSPKPESNGSAVDHA